MTNGQFGVNRFLDAHREAFLEWMNVNDTGRAVPEGLLMTDFFDLARGALHAQPFSMLLGTELVQIGERELTLRLPIRDELRQQHGFVHSGVISYLADNALTFAGAIALGPRVVNGEYKISYLRPAVRGALLARAELVYVGRGHATCQCHVYVLDGDKEMLVALAQGTVNRVGDGTSGSGSMASSTSPAAQDEGG